MRRDTFMKKMRKLFVILLLACSLACSGKEIMDGRTLQTRLDEGKDIALRFVTYF